MLVPPILRGQCVDITFDFFRLSWIGYFDGEHLSKVNCVRRASKARPRLYVIRRSEVFDSVFSGILFCGNVSIGIASGTVEAYMYQRGAKLSRCWVTESHMMTLPSGSKLAVEWYILAIVVFAKPVVNRWPLGAEGVYSHGVKTD
jgi:hypothetical protein